MVKLLNHSVIHSVICCDIRRSAHPILPVAYYDALYEKALFSH